MAWRLLLAGCLLANVALSQWTQVTLFDSTTYRTGYIPLTISENLSWDQTCCAVMALMAWNETDGGCYGFYLDASPLTQQPNTVDLADLPYDPLKTEGAITYNYITTYDQLPRFHFVDYSYVLINTNASIKWNARGDSTHPDETDLISVMTHEFGHWLTLNDCQQDTNSTMYWQIKPGRERRSLSRDAVQAMASIYGYLLPDTTITTDVDRSLVVPYGKTLTVTGGGVINVGTNQPFNTKAVFVRVDSGGTLRLGPSTIVNVKDTSVMILNKTAFVDKSPGSGYGAEAAGYLYDFTPQPDTIRGPTLRTLHLMAGWNLVSEPLYLNDYDMHGIIPDACSPAYGFNGFYYSVMDTMWRGVGCWVKVPQARDYTIYGNRIPQKVYDCLPGWQIVGCISADQVASKLDISPVNLLMSPFFKYDGTRYVPADTLRAGCAYWVKCRTSGYIIMSHWGMNAPKGEIR